MRHKLAAALIAAASVLTPLAVTGPASAVASCTPGTTTHETVTVAGITWYLAAPLNVIPGSAPELKTFGTGVTPNSTTLFLHCDVTTGVLALQYQQGSALYALRNNPSDENEVVFEPVTGGPSIGQVWTRDGWNPSTFKSGTGLYLRVSNKGLGEYFPVVAGLNYTKWTQ